MSDKKEIWTIRVGDGHNFINSKKKIWGMKRGNHNGILSIINKIQPGDILAFHSNKKGGSKLLAFAKYIRYYDQMDEPIININCYSNDELGWIGDEDWTIQIHYTDLYNTDKLNIIIKYQCAGIISNYNKILENQYKKKSENKSESWNCTDVNAIGNKCLKEHFELIVKYLSPSS